VKGLVGRWSGRVGEALPTVRARLYALVAVTLLPALVILGYDEWLARRRGLEALNELARSVGRLMRLDLDGRIDRAAGRLSTLAGDPEVVAVGPMAPRRLVDAFRDDRLYNNLMIVDPAGDLRVSAVPYDKAYSARERTAYQRALQKLGLGIGAFVVEPATGEAGLNVGRPALDANGRLASVVLANLDLGWIVPFLERSGLPPGTVFVVLDGRGNVQYRSAEHERYEGKHDGLSAGQIASAVDPKGTCVALGIDGTERLYAGGSLDFQGQHTGSVALLGIPLGSWRAAMNDALRQNLVILGVGTLLCFLMAWLVSELLFLREMRPILSTAKGLAAGDLTGRTGVVGRGEMGDLARSLDEGIETLQMSQQALREATEAAVEASKAKGSFLAMMSH
jgi:hypothetical protein